MTGDHERFDELAVGWALHALEPDDEAEFGRHLPGCARCAETVAQTTEVMAGLAADLPPAEPSAGLRSRLREAVAGTAQGSGPVPAPVADRPAVPAALPSPRRPRALPLALVAAAVAAVVGLGVWNVVLGADRRELETTVAQQREVVEALLTPGEATVATLDGDGGPVATVVARADRLQVVSHGLAVNDPGSTTYVLWGLGQDGPKALGTFDVEQSQMGLRTVGSGLTGLDEFPQYGISIEPGQEAPSAPTDVVATGQVTS